MQLVALATRGPLILTHRQALSAKISPYLPSGRALAFNTPITTSFSMIRLSGPRCMAMTVAGVLLGWWSNTSSVTGMAHYRNLSHEELLTELASTNDGALSTSIMGGLFVVIGIVLLVDVLTRFFRALWHRIEPPGAHSADSGTPKAAA